MRERRYRPKNPQGAPAPELALLNQALKKSEERFRFLVQQVKDYAIIYLDTKGCVATWNEGAEQIYGYRAADALGKHVSLFHAKDAVERRDAWKMLELAVAEGQFKGEDWRVRGDGSRFWADVVITALHDAAGRLQGFAVVTRNINERRRAEDALNHRIAMEELVITISNRFLNTPSEALDEEINRALEAVRSFVAADRSYLCLLSDSFAITALYESLSGGIPSRNQRFKSFTLQSLPWLLGELKRGEAISLCDIADIPAEANAEKAYWQNISPVQALLVIPVILGQTLRGFLALNSDREKKRWALEDVKLLRTVGEIFGGCLERRQSEQRHRELEMEILEAERREMEMRQRENNRWIDLGQMASGIAHDIRNPINFVSLALEHLSEKERKGREEALKTRELFAEAHSELLRVNEMIQGLLDYGRQQTLDLRIENASEILAQSRDEIVRRHTGREINIVLEGTGDVFPICIDRGLLFRAVVNLLDNALEAGDPGAVVRAGVNRNENNVVLWTEDSGPGISVEHLEKIFTPYFTTKKAGVGLGLTLARKWVNEMGGNIRVENLPVRGARFVLSFPTAGSPGPLSVKRKKRRLVAVPPRV